MLSPYIKHLYAYWSPGLQLSPAQIQEIDSDFGRPGRLAAAIAYYHFGAADQSDQHRTELYNRTISVPTLIVTGAEDVLTGVAEAELMRRNIAGSRLKVISRAGHYAPWEQPGEVGHLLRQFFDGLEPA